MADDGRVAIYKSIACFLQHEIDSMSHLSEITESLEVAKQCIETAFHFSVANVTNAIDLPLALDFYSKAQAKLTRTQPSAESLSMAETLKNQGNLCMKEDKFEEAVACYTKAIELSPDTAVFYCNRAAAYSRLNKHQKAIDDCKIALEIDPQYSKAYGRMGIAYSSLENHAKAVECYRKSLELDPTNVNCQQNLSVAEERLRNSTSDVQEPTSLGGFDLNSILNNPMMQNMARQFLTDPNAQNMMTSLLRNTFGVSETGQTPATQTSAPVNNSNEPQNQTGPTQVDGSLPGNMDDFLRLGQQLAQQLQTSNPQLVNQLRQTFHSNLSGASAPPSSNTNGPNA